MADDPASGKTSGLPPSDAAVPEPADGAAKPPPTVFQCLSGAAIAAALGYGAFSLTQNIAANFAAHPFRSENYVAVNISIAVRTLVTGMFALASGVFALAALGLLGLGIQTLLQKLRGTPAG